MKFEFSGKILEKYPNIEFYENVFSGSRIVANDHTDKESTKLIVAFRSFTKPQMSRFRPWRLHRGNTRML